MHGSTCSKSSVTLELGNEVFLRIMVVSVRVHLENLRWTKLILLGDLLFSGRQKGLRDATFIVCSF